MFGPDWLVGPVYTEGVRSRSIYLPGTSSLLLGSVAGLLLGSVAGFCCWVLLLGSVAGFCCWVLLLGAGLQGTAVAAKAGAASPSKGPYLFPKASNFWMVTFLSFGKKQFPLWLRPL